MTEEKSGVAIIDSRTLKERIYFIRGQKVMLDFDLAELYGYTTKRFNEQVKNNIGKFDLDFRFQITKEEVNLVRSKNSTSRGRDLFAGQSGGSRYLPFAFTEQGIYMLMTVLRGPLAAAQSKALIRLFKGMKDYLIENRATVGITEFKQLVAKVSENAADTDRRLKGVEKTTAEAGLKLEKVMENFIDPAMYKHFLIFDGEKIEADSAYAKIYKTARHSIYVVDNYIGLKTLELLRAAKPAVKIIVFSDNLRNRESLTAATISDFGSEYPDVDLSFQTSGGRYHDRYIFIDYKYPGEAVYHCGSSSKDSGTRITAITKVEDNMLYRPLVDELLMMPQLSFNN